jgi:hypothetical protein
MHWALSHANSALQRLPKARARNNKKRKRSEELGTSDEEEEMGESIDEWEEEIAMMHDDNGGGERKDEAAMAPLDKGLILIGAFLSLYTNIWFSVLDDIAVDNSVMQIALMMEKKIEMSLILLPMITLMMRILSRMCPPPRTS